MISTAIRRLGVRELVTCTAILGWIGYFGQLAVTAQETSTQEAATQPTVTERDAPPAPAVDGDVSSDAPEQEVGARRFLRLRYPESVDDRVTDPLGLDTAIVRYTQPDRPEVTVDLVAAVHVGERAYYEALNARFRKYDVVLYELVAEQGAQVSPQDAERRNHPVTMLQGGMQDALGLQHQLRWIDYSRPNFVRADMTPGEFLDSMKRRDESFGKLFFRMIGNALAAQSEQGSANDLRLMSAMFRDNREQHMKVAMAEQLLQFGGSLPALDGPQGSTIITERNKKALAVLGEQLSSRRSGSIAIFYGAAHMPDIEQRLQQEFGFQRASVQWVEAWNLTEPGIATRKDNAREAVHE